MQRSSVNYVQSLIVLGGLLLGFLIGYLNRPSFMGFQFPLLEAIERLENDPLASETVWRVGMVTLAGGALGVILAAIFGAIERNQLAAHAVQRPKEPEQVQYQKEELRKAEEARDAEAAKLRQMQLQRHEDARKMALMVFVSLPQFIGRLAIHFPRCTSYVLFGRVLQLGEESTLAIRFFHVVLWTAAGFGLFWLLLF